MSFPLRNLWSWVKRPQKRGYDAAGGGRRWPSQSSLRAPNTTTLGARQPVMVRARYAAANNGYAAQGCETLTAALIGNGIRPQSKHEIDATRADVNAQFNAWTEEADGEGRLNLGALQTQAVRCMIRDGEFFARIRVNEVGRLEVQPLSPDQVDPNKNSDLGGGARIVAGIEFDAEGKRRAYWIFPDNPDQPFATSLVSIRVPAEDIIHMFRPMFPGQVRGISWFATILLRLSDHDASSDAILMRLKTEALFAGFLYDQGGAHGGFDGEATDSVLESGLEPGTLKVLPPGTEIKFSQPSAGTATAADFLKAQLREIAAGLGCTYERLTGDLSGVNYSSIRAGEIEFRRRMEAVQKQVIIPQFVRPIWRRWILTEILAGRLAAPDFETNPEGWLGATFITPGWPWVDPQKEIAAERDAVEVRFKSRREVVAGRGRDIDELDAEIAAERGPIDAGEAA